VSLILDALKKLERDRGRADRSVVVVGSGQWGAREHHMGRRVVTGLGAAALLLAGFGLWRALSHEPVRAPAPAPPPPSAPVESAPAVLPPAEPGPPAAGLPAPAESPRPAAAPIASTPPASPIGSARERPADVTREPPAAGAVAHEPQATPRASPGDSAPYRLTAIAQRDGRPVAVLNDRLVREGDSFDGVTVIRIGAAEVEIEVAGRRLVIEF
jgi:hypothetical protein